MSAPTQYRHHVTHTTARDSRLILGYKKYIQLKMSCFAYIPESLIIFE